MTKKVLVGAFALAFVLAPYGGASVHAADDATVSIDDPSVSCGEQSISFSGTAKFDQSNDHLVVTLNGEQIHHQHDMSDDVTQSWTTASTSVGVGSHTLVATVYDMGITPPHSGVEATKTVEFTVSDCSGGSSGGDGGSSGGDGGSGDEQDCCPGPDPVVGGDDSSKTGKVKGVTVSADDWARLKPLNSIFRSVYGRNPTFAEWEYWANRLLTDKPQYDALYGAMQWHELRGRSIGD